MAPKEYFYTKLDSNSTAYKSPKQNYAQPARHLRLKKKNLRDEQTGQYNDIFCYYSPK